MLVFLALISKSVNSQCYNPYIFGKLSKRSFQKYMGCSLPLIVNHFRDKRKKRNETEMILLKLKIPIVPLHIKEPPLYSVSYPCGPIPAMQAKLKSHFVV